MTRKTIIGLAVAGALALPAVAGATDRPPLDLTPGPGCMSHAPYVLNEPQHGNNPGHVEWGGDGRFAFSNEHGNNIPPYDPPMSSADFRAGCFG